MAHFHEISVTIATGSPGERISCREIPCRDINGSAVSVGVWGRDFSNVELVVVPTLPSGPSSAVTAEKKRQFGQSREWTITSVVAGPVRLEARTVDGAVWDWVVLNFIATSGEVLGPYTTNPNEVLTRNTVPTIPQVVQKLLSSWNGLTSDGARTFASQWAYETGFGKYCYNWNLGNVKAGPHETHMYLTGIWEVFGESVTRASVRDAGGFAHIASDEEKRRHGWTGAWIPVFYPPHPQCRFRSYTTFDEGAEAIVRRFQRLAARSPDFFAAANSGDAPAVATALKQINYYQGSETDYRNGMASCKAAIDRALALPSAGH